MLSSTRILVDLAVLLLAYLVVVLPLHSDEDMLSTITAVAAPLKVLPRRVSLPISSFYNKAAVPLSLSTQQQRQHLSTAKMGYETLSFKDAVANRRSVYPLTKKSTIPDAKIKEVVEQAIRDVPSSFNSQSSRAVVLVKGEHDRFWEIVTGILKAHVPEDKWEHTKGRMDMFKGAYGTVCSITFSRGVKGWADV